MYREFHVRGIDDSLPTSVSLRDAAVGADDDDDDATPVLPAGACSCRRPPYMGFRRAT